MFPKTCHITHYRSSGARSAFIPLVQANNCAAPTNHHRKCPSPPQPPGAIRMKATCFPARMLLLCSESSSHFKAHRQPLVQGVVMALGLAANARDIYHARTYRVTLSSVEVERWLPFKIGPWSLGFDRREGEIVQRERECQLC